MPNTYDQIAQTQHQDIKTLNIAPGYSRVIGSSTLLTANAFVRRDHLTYLPSANPLGDTPATVSQDRTLTNYGGKVDVAYTSGIHNVKTGVDVSATTLRENFTLRHHRSDRRRLPARPTAASTRAFAPSTSPTAARRSCSTPSKTITSAGAYVQDEINAGERDGKLGLRFDHYDGLTSDSLLQPRLGFSYAVPVTNTILRASWGRTLETPYNENLLLSAGYGASGALVGQGTSPASGRRNEGEVGVQQAFGNWVVVDAGYFNKHTHNGYDFNVLFDTPIVFPVAWDHSRIDGFTGRVNLVQHGGFSAFVVMAHTNAIFSPPGVGGVLLEQPGGDFRIDHDQKFNSTTNLQYEFNKAHWRVGGAVVAVRFGLVDGSVASLEDALALTADQQAAIGFYCGSVSSSLGSPLTSAQCTASNFGATRIRIPAEGTENDVSNPPRIAPRHLFDLGLGADNLLHTDRAKTQGALQRDQPGEQGSALQLPVDVQRDALRDAAGVSTQRGCDVLSREHPTSGSSVDRPSRAL